jgi:glucokinase
MRPNPNLQAPYVLGVDIGGTKLATVLATRDGQMLHKERLPTEEDKGPEFGVARLISMIRRILSGIDDLGGLDAVAGIGIACGSPMDAGRGIILGPPNLQSWNPVPIVDILEREFGLYARLENDANAGALAEWRFGAGRGKRSVVYMTMGTGIGGGLVLDGRLYRGANGNAGEVGHMRVTPQGGPPCGCGKRGCLEAYCSGPAIARRAREELARAHQEHTGEPETAQTGAVLLDLAGSIETVTAEHLFAAARKGDALALRLVDETAHLLGVGLANVIQVLNPEAIVLGTIATEQGDFFLDRVRQAARAETWPQMFEVVEILPSPLGSRVGDYGAISVLLHALDAGDC